MDQKGAIGTLREVHNWTNRPMWPQYATLPRTELPDRLGTHLTRRVGPGVEYADVRPYLPGDQLRTINWAVRRPAGVQYIESAAYTSVTS